MRTFRLGRWGYSNLFPLGTRQRLFLLDSSSAGHNIRHWSTIPLLFASDPSSVKRKRGRPRKTQPLKSSVAAVQPVAPEPDAEEARHSQNVEQTSLPDQPVAASPSISIKQNSIPPENLPSPPASSTASSAKLSALHARLALPSRLPLQTLSRTLIDRTADPDSRFSNESLAHLGNDLLGYYMAEHLLCHYPRLPLAVLFAAQYAYVGPRTLSSVAEEWGIEAAAEPGNEVDPGLLQFKRAPPGSNTEEFDESTRPSDTNRKGDKVDWKRGMSSRIVYDDTFGDPQPNPESAGASSHTTTLDRAATGFVRALTGAMYLHAGSAPAHDFFRTHILSRQLDLSSLFTFRAPTRDLSRLCAREGFERPVARLIAESGRLSRHPVFVVGICSGRDMLGEGAGASLDEARFKAAVAALKGWYLYSPTPAAQAQGEDVMVPSQMEGEIGKARKWRPAMIDLGEVVT